MCVCVCLCVFVCVFVCVCVLTLESCSTSYYTCAGRNHVACNSANVFFADVFYTVSTATNQKAAEKLVNKLTEDLKKANLHLKPRPGPQAKGPTLQIRESTNDWKFKDLCEESQDLGR